MRVANVPRKEFERQVESDDLTDCSRTRAPRIQSRESTIFAKAANHEVV
jgi:hypothetical protein